MSTSKKALSLADIDGLCNRLLENCSALISDAELLLANHRHPRAFALSVIAVEEASKIQLLLQCAEGILAGDEPDWAEIHASLHSHREKLMANLLGFKRIQSRSKVPLKGSAEWDDAVARVKEMNGFKQDGLYVSFGDAGIGTPAEKFDEERTRMVVRLAQVSFNTSDLMTRGFEAKVPDELRLIFALGIQRATVKGSTRSPSRGAQMLIHALG